MVRAKDYFLVLFASMLVSCATKEELTSSETQVDLSAATVLSIEHKIRDMVRQSRDWEMPEYRTYNCKDINGDGVVDTILLTTFEHGNYWRRELLVCLSSLPSDVMHVNLGGKANKMAEQVELKNSTIIVRGKSYAHGDALCCPSQPYESRFVVADGKIVQMN